MSDPQTEDGYTRIANELLDAILRFPFSKRELNIVLAVIRKTYGYNKKADDMTLTQLADLTSMDLANVSRAVASLSAQNVLLKRQGKYGYILGINKKYSTWNACQNGNLAKLASDPCQIGKRTLPKRQEGLAKTANTKDNPKRQLQKTTTKENVGDKSPPRFSEDDMAIAKEIFSGVLELNPKHKPPNMNKWAECVRLMRERDGRTHAEIRALWAWVHRDGFWMKNILSPDKLREKWDRLVIQSKEFQQSKASAEPRPLMKEFPR